MIYLIVILTILIMLFGINYYYTEVVLHDSQVNRILKAKKGKWDIVTLGSTMCKYAFDFKDSGIKGFNFGYAAQFFYYTDITLRSYSKYFNKGCWVVITCPDLVFAEPGKGVYFLPEMMKMLPKRLLGDEYLLRRYIMHVIFPVFFHPSLLITVIRYLLGHNQQNDLSIADNPLDSEGMKKSADAIYASWDRFDLKKMASNSKSEVMEKRICQSRDLLTGMIQYCLDHGFRPVLAVTPISKFLSEYMQPFKERILYENINLANKQNVPVLLYSQDERFQEDSLFLSSIKLNATGRKLLTETLLQDIKQLEAQNGKC